MSPRILECLVILTIAVVLVTVPIRAYLALDQDWQAIYQAMTPVDWFIAFITMVAGGVYLWWVFR